MAQLYVHDADASFRFPSVSSGIRAAPSRTGEIQTVSLTLNAADLASFDTDTERFDVDPGEFDILVGASSEDIRVAGRVTVGGR